MMGHFSLDQGARGEDDEEWSVVYTISRMTGFFGDLDVVR